MVGFVQFTETACGELPELDEHRKAENVQNFKPEGSLGKQKKVSSKQLVKNSDSGLLHSVVSLVFR